MIKPYKKALVVLSGGQDSTTCLFFAIQRLADEVIALTFNYGQRHALEIGAATTVANLAGVRHEVVDMGPILHGTSPLVNQGQAVESYASAAVLPGGIEKTFVPMRNALFLVIAANRAVVEGCDVIVTGVSEEDYGGYPDCRKSFIDAMNAAILEAIGESAKAPHILTPLMFRNKKKTVELANDLPGCFVAMAFTHTCYKGEYPPCGTCHACLLRAKGFAEAGYADPIYSSLRAMEGA